MTIMRSQFLRIVHEHGFSRGVFGTAEAPSNISSVPYTYYGGEVMSMSDMTPAEKTGGSATTPAPGRATGSRLQKC